jgi:hypothetical protein
MAAVPNENVSGNKRIWGMKKSILHRCFFLLGGLSLLCLTQTSVALAEPYFCKIPTLKHQVDDEIESLFDPLILNAVFSQSPRRSPPSFAHFIRSQVLKKAWRGLGKKSRKKLLADPVYRERLLELHLDQVSVQSTVISRSDGEFKRLLDVNHEALFSCLNTKTLLNIFLSIHYQSEGMLSAALEYICHRVPGMNLDRPHQSARLQQIQFQIREISRKNQALIHGFLDNLFPLVIPDSIYSEKLGHFLGQVKNLDLIRNVLDPSYDLGGHRDLKYLREKTLSLSRSNLKLIAEEFSQFLNRRLFEVNKFLHDSKKSLDYFKVQKIAFMSRLSHPPYTEEDTLGLRLRVRENLAYVVFNEEGESRTQLRELEESLLWRQLARVVIQNDRSIQKLYLSFFYFGEQDILGELPSWKFEMDERIASSSKTKTPSE